MPDSSSPTRGLTALAIGFLTISVPVETAYSWRHLGDAYYMIKVTGWLLLGWSVARMRAKHYSGLVVATAGWAWMGANFARAVADRLAKMSAGEALRLGSIELVFAGSCLVVCIAGVSWSLAQTRWTDLARTESDVPR